MITSEFVTAAETMAGVLGAPGLPFVTVPHPISSATGQALAQTARDATAACAAVLTAP